MVAVTKWFLQELRGHEDRPATNDLRRQPAIGWLTSEKNSNRKLVRTADNGSVIGRARKKSKDGKQNVKCRTSILKLA
ncbi:hypothetical protein OIU74_010792 [Salix koriyanagi]|uniref:Uncharacterized protein n=1 Tax=Salix koriyanagi TaxID=2511006 RepID=A0A9Q0TDR8_9ROSI|nr:hypothetical protein OIU74_010792 [Salix koriyanagi]